ncbi:nitrilase-related carbon-nitrogen hydrolase [Pseudomonas sp. WHRI 8519]|uniref:nitrilase-related carbon-nitrogen hydrolase n=1 Tax=Pseudomonas sp. WHRI 8519 TaxID=3162567 RepID=UPI0032EE8DDD
MLDQLKVSVAVFEIRRYAAFQDFAEHVESVVLEAKAAGSRALLLPEFLPMGLLWTSPDAARVSNQTVSAFYRDVLTPLYPAFVECLTALAKAHDIYIVGATYWHEENGEGFNSAFVFKPDGSFERQHKVHLTRGEKAIQTSGASSLNDVFEIDGVKCGVFICYDVQFPELTRSFAAAGAEVIFVPALTEERGSWREWFSAHARALENQVYVCVSPLVGDLGIPNDYPVSCMGKAFVACPIDNRMGVTDGTYAEGALNVAGLLNVELDLSRLRLSREKGEVRHLRDRRPELYSNLKL